MFGRTTIFVAVLSGTMVALALLAEATHFSRDTLSLALLLISVVLFIGLATFVRRNFAGSSQHSVNHSLVQLQRSRRETLDKPTWRDTTIIRENVIESVRTLKTQPGKDIVTDGSSQLVHALLQHDLVDELHLSLYPLSL